MHNKNGYISVPMDEGSTTPVSEDVVDAPRGGCKLTPIKIKIPNIQVTPAADTFSPSLTSRGSGGNAFKHWQRAENKQARLNSHLLTSIQNGEFEQVKKFLLMGANPNAMCRSNNVAAINLAAVLGFKDIVRELLWRGACINFEDNNGQNILHYLAFAESVDCLEEIINYSKEQSRNVNILSTIINQRAGISRPQPNLVKTFTDNLEHNCDEINHFIPIFDPGSTPLHVACQLANAKICQLLVDNDADVEIEDERGNLPMNVVGEAFLNTGDEQLQNELDCFFQTIQFCLSINAKFRDICDYTFSMSCYCKESLPPIISPIHTAIELRHLDAINILLAHGASPAAINSQGETAIHQAILIKNEEILKVVTDCWVKGHDTINLKNCSGYTPFQTAVDLQWIPGIYILLEAGADVTEVAHNYDSALHIAAATGNLNLVQELLDIEETRQVLELPNNNNETPLFCAVRSGNLDCVQALLKVGANVYAELPDNVTLLHQTAEHGFCDILYEIVRLAKETGKRAWLNKRDTSPTSGRTALHIAAAQGQFSCVETLLGNGCDVSIITTSHPHNSSTALHLAAQSGQFRVVELLLKHELTILKGRNGSGYTALHLAAAAGQRKSVQMLLRYGADLADPAAISPPLTGADIIVQNISRPTEFLEEVFDSCVTKNEFSVNDPNCLITVNHTILMPGENSGEVMKVLKAILNTGNRFGQKRLLLHPVVEGYLHTKWQALSPFFYLNFVLHIINGIALTIVAMSLYFFSQFDLEKKWVQHLTIFAAYVVLVTLLIIIFQEILLARQNIKKYILALESWLKWTCFILSGMIVVREIAGADITSQVIPEQWFRHVTSVAILLTWIELMFLFSRFPIWGYYVLMFFKVAKTVVKVLLTFCFLIIGFSYSFLIEFQTTPPFTNPLTAIVKTIVMMTSEYDYADLFTETGLEVYIGRLIFMAFVVLVSIVLMNLMVGLAVDDISGLAIKGQIQRLEKQIDFLSALCCLVHVDANGKSTWTGVMKKELDNWMPTRERIISFYPDKPAENMFGAHVLPLCIIERLTDIAEITQQENEITLQMLNDKMERWYQTLNQKLDRLAIKKEEFIKDTRLLKAGVDKPKKKLLKHLQNILKRHEATAKSTCQSSEDVCDGFSNATATNAVITDTSAVLNDSQRLDSIERTIKNFECLLRQTLQKSNLI